MISTTRLPGNASVYELVRTGHSSLEQLNRIGFTREDLSLGIGEAARRRGVSVERLATFLSERPI